MDTIRLQRMEFFDELASSWDEDDGYSDKQNRLRDIIQSLDIKSGDKILDLGTGTGISLQPLVESATEWGTVVGLDLSQKMLKISKEKHDILVRGDCHNLPFRQSAFDVVFAFALIPHVDNVFFVIQQVSAILSNNGLFVILHFMSREIINDFHRKAGTAVENDLLPSRKELNEMALPGGFQPVGFQENDDLFLWTARKVTD